MKRLLLACVSIAARRFRACVVLVALSVGISTVSAALPTPNTDTDYLFVPGHGLTRRTSGDPEKPLSEAINEAKAINADPAYRVKIGFIEEAYTWEEMQKNNSSVGDINITRLKADLQACYNEGLRLRVFLSTHKYDASFPHWVINSATPEGGGHVRLVKSGTKVVNNQTVDNMVWMVNLHRPATYNLLKQLYERVMVLLKAEPSHLKATFYGFVLQESNTGYQNEFSVSETEDWFANLRLLHTDLSVSLRDVQTGVGTKKHRLFWQMINYPDVQTVGIVESVRLKHGGLCGPDTFPREPHLKSLTPANNFERGLANAYDEIRTASEFATMPTSLHVYALNYNKPYQGGVFVDPVNQPIYSTADLDNDSDGLSTPSGIVNFLGCVPSVPIPKHANSLNVHNVVWSLADGPGTTEYPWTGWSRVKNWMKDTNTSKTPTDIYGGCNPTTPGNL